MTAAGLNPYMTAQGFSSSAMVAVIIGAVSNIVLDPFFIFALHMDVRGAAVATVLSQAFSALYVYRFLTGNQAELKLRIITPSRFASRLSLAGEIVSLGMSAFVMQFTNSLVNIVCNSVLSSFGGELYVSIMTVVNSVRQITETPVLAIAEGASPVISYNYGAGRPQKVRRGIFLMAAMGLFYTAAVWILIERFPSFFIGIFSTDSTFMADAIPALHTYFFAFVFMALQYTGQTTFKALGKKRHAIFFSLFRKVVIVVPLTILLPRLFGLGTTGVFMAESISNVIGGTACFVTMLLTVMPELGS
jgi:Na+-driven multidrug efflux pump